MFRLWITHQPSPRAYERDRYSAQAEDALRELQKKSDRLNDAITAAMKSKLQEKDE